MKKFLVIALTGIGLWTGCCKVSNSNSSYTPTCTGPVKSYTKDVAPIIRTYCSGCHSNFSSRASLAADGNVVGYIESGSMPRGGASLSTAQKDAIICWFNSGAPNN